MRSQLKKKRQPPEPIAASSANTEASGDPSTIKRKKPDDSRKYEIAQEWSLLIENVAKDVSEATSILAPLKSTMALVIRGLEIIRSMIENKAALKELEEELVTQLQQITEWVDQPEAENRTASSAAKLALQRYTESLVQIKEEIDKAVERSQAGLRGKFKRSVTIKMEQNAIVDLTSRINGTFQQFSGTMSIVLSQQITDLSNQITDLQFEVQQQFLSLQPTKQVDYGNIDSFLHLSSGGNVELCEPGTREGILGAIRQWADDTASSKPIFWLRDAAGTGKSTVAATMAGEWSSAKRLAARFFFSPNSTATSIITHFCVAFAKDMATQVPALKASIYAAITGCPVTHFSLRQQFERLITEPLRRTSFSIPRIMVVDAVDNCDPEGRTTLLECIISQIPTLINVRIFVTSRPLTDIDVILYESPLVYGRDLQLLDIHDKSYTDVRLYIQRQLSKLSIEEHDTLTNHSGGLFIWAATACRMLKRSRRPAELMTQLLDAKTTGRLDELYLEALRQAVVDPNAHDLMMNVLQLIIAAFQPISISTIEALLPDNRYVYAFVQDLGALLKDGHPERPIFVIHSTFREFIAQADSANGFLIDLPTSHGTMAIACIDLLAGLEDYVLNIQTTDELFPRNSDIADLERLVNQRVSVAIKYASSYWAHHAAASQEDDTIWKKVLLFLSTKLLAWIELMSWRGNISGCISGLWKLHAKSRQTVDLRQYFVTTPYHLHVSHAYNFAVQNQYLLQESALHTYTTALAFSPTDSPLLQPYRAKYQENMPVIVSTTPIKWPSHQTLSAQSALSQIAFSPDASRLIGRTQAGLLQLWDTESGSMVVKTDGNSVVHFSVSWDGKRLAFATEESKILILNVRTGAEIGRPIDASPGSISQVVFSPVAPHIISASREPTNEIRCWNTETGELTGLRMSLPGPSIWIAISPDGQRLVSASHDEDAFPAVIVTLWNLNTFGIVTRYMMPRIWKSACLDFNGKGDRFATWDGHGTVYLRQSATGHPSLDNANMYAQGVEDALFSPTDDYMAARNDYSCDIGLWNLYTNKRSYLKGHNNVVCYISFSESGEQLASVANDQTVRVWEVSSGAALQSFFTGYTGDIKQPLLSSDWSKFVTITVDHQINLYDISVDGSGDIMPEPRGASRPRFAFSPLNNLIICGYDHVATLQLWNLDTATPFGAQLLGHRDGISSVAFAFNGQRVASGSWDKSVRLWDPYAQAQVGQPMERHKDRVSSLMFSPDDRHLASISKDSIHIWDTRTTAHIWSVPTSPRESCEHIAFSPDSNEIAGFAHFNEELCIWKLNGEKRTVEDYQGSVEGLVFSPTGQLLVSMHRNPDHCIVLWNVDDRIVPMATLVVGMELSHLPTLQEYRLGISSDGVYLTLGSSIWNISYTPPRLLGRNQRPSSLIENSNPHQSLLCYIEGWIYSAYPQGRLLPVPDQLRARFKNWRAVGSKMVVWTASRSPIVIDCSPVLKRFL